MNLLLIIFASWILCLTAVYLWKKSLLKSTWREPYFADTPILIESDDWGPGADFQAGRLSKILSCLESHKDSVNRSAVITADIVLSAPDIEKITTAPDFAYHRKMLDEHYPEIYQAMLKGIKTGTFVPQLHGLEHLNSQALSRLCQQNDSRVADAVSDPNGWNWESLAPPLQGHYVDGSSLPSQSIKPENAQTIIALATQTFQMLFGNPSISTVAPCYLWNSEIESIWQSYGIRVIQTAGYRCDGIDENGKHHEDKQLIRPGDKSDTGQIYLVRNVMYEPVDGRHNAETAYQEALSAFTQALPICISTHRYNYTRSEEDFQQSLTGLDKLLSAVTQTFSNTRFVSSPELGEQISSATAVITNPFNDTQWPPLKQLSGTKKIAPFLRRLYTRHPKLVLLSYLTGLIIPVWLICGLGKPKQLTLLTEAGK